MYICIYTYIYTYIESALKCSLGIVRSEGHRQLDSVTAEVWPGQVKLARCSRNSDQISWMPTEMRWKPQMVVTVAAPRRMQGMSVILDDFQTIWMIFRQIWMIFRQIWMIFRQIWMIFRQVG